jgi:hypothetical protein
MVPGASAPRLAGSPDNPGSDPCDDFAAEPSGFAGDFFSGSSYRWQAKGRNIKNERNNVTRFMALFLPEIPRPSTGANHSWAFVIFFSLVFCESHGLVF